MKAFIIDDDPITLTLIAFMLNEEGIETKYALSPLIQDFYKEVVAFNPDVVVLDIYLKDEDGFKVASELRKHEELHYTPIVAISGSHNLGDKLQAYASGFIDYLEKPFTKDEILSAVRSYGYTHEILRLCNKILNQESVDDYLNTKSDKE